LNIITPVPFYDRNEKDTEIAVSHKHLISAITSAQAANHGFSVIKYFLTLAHATYKEHNFLLKLNIGFLCSSYNRPDGNVTAKYND
jgi:thiamine biosynthesis protein ThiC